MLMVSFSSFVDINDCAENPCVNGVCTDTGPVSYSCECSDGWQGENCEIGKKDKTVSEPID